MSKQASFTVKFIATLTARNAEVHSADTVTAIANAERCKVGLDQVMDEPQFKEIAAQLIRRARVADVKADKLNYIAVKVLVKVIATLQAIATKLPSDLDPYTRTIGANLCKLNGISNKSNLVCLSKSVEYDALDSQQSLTKRYNCSANTAGTQSSSTRMALKYLGIADVSKGKRGDVMSLLDNERAKQFVAIFSDKVIAEEQEAKGNEE